jgi:hypothetical protein
MHESSMMEFTSTIAGSCVSVLCGGSRTCKSSISAPRKIIYSKISSRGGTGRSVGRPSVPKERTKTKSHNLLIVFSGEEIYLLKVPQLIH